MWTRRSSPSPRVQESGDKRHINWAMSGSYNISNDLRIHRLIILEGWNWILGRLLGLIFCYDNLLVAILKMVNLTMSRQYFSLETVISEIYAKFPIRMLLSPKSTLDVRMDFSLPEWSLHYSIHFDCENFPKRNIYFFLLSLWDKLTITSKSFCFVLFRFSACCSVSQCRMCVCECSMTAH